MSFLQSDLPGNAPNHPLAVKKIPRQGLTDLFLSPEDQDGMTAAEIERWSAEIGNLEFKMMKPLLRESVASRTLGGHPHILRYIESFWTNSHRKPIGLLSKTKEAFRNNYLCLDTLCSPPA